ncbi:MAG: hypothetical protein HOD97_07000 [Candidatus Marinimicrobia bacterium]|jgi:outer membrane lipoprotein-sorting protein|nr:hypothetical protein [Candidatus Neomarinimicrobiota bacterium]MBT3617678.1 hypothetical protein [Candidatus Neomarinimicrobiota bacterium]MBT3829048.1 hypothetical protein [Candidatus Neomarinimicrobiota bacterium]MBT3997770.1 hypothetical protein [Candidatus Neomarinimicrobiota bacterium]MBT4281343.1 hypothetical protein [Candidatus Neomarinimicrobiota bacterium]
MIKYLIILTGFLFAGTPSVESIQDSLITRFNQIEDYTVKIKVSVKMTGLRMPRKKIKIYYKAPDKIKIKSTGFAIVPKTGLGGSPEQYLSMLDSVFVSRSEDLDGIKHWVLAGLVNPDSMDIPIPEDDFPNIKMNLWVDAESWVISKAETMIDSQKVFHLMSEYEMVDGFLLPIKTTLSLGFKGMERWSMRDPFGGPAADRQDIENLTKDAGVNPKESEFAGTVIMEFSKYKVNQGLDDSIFEE